MNSWYIAYEVEVQRREEEIALAEKHRLLQENKAAQVPVAKRTGRWLVNLGILMVAWGYRLQSRGMPNYARFEVRSATY